jgi:hypothetical protein
MPASTTTACSRPIRELLCPDAENPIRTGTALDERRKERRYPRQLPGVLIDGDLYHSVWCMDISYAGVKVIAPNALNFAKGKRVQVKIKQATRSFQDEFAVVEMESSPKGTILHLAM